MNTPKCPRCANGMARIGDDPWFCLLCPDEPQPEAATYSDDIVAVMRATISAQRAAIQSQRALIDELQTTIDEGALALALAKAIIGADRERRVKEGR